MKKSIWKLLPASYCIFSLLGCSPDSDTKNQKATSQELKNLVNVWQCGKTMLTFREDGTYEIAEGSATKDQGTFSVAENKITIDKKAAYPLNEFSTVNIASPSDLILDATDGQQLICKSADGKAASHMTANGS